MDIIISSSTTKISRKIVLNNKAKPTISLHLPDDTVVSFCYLKSNKFDNFTPKQVIYNVQKNKIAFLANVGQAIDAAILRLILTKMQERGIQTIPLHDCVTVLSTDVDKTQRIIQEVYVELHNTRDI